MDNQQPSLYQEIINTEIVQVLRKIKGKNKLVNIKYYTTKCKTCGHTKKCTHGGKRQLYRRCHVCKNKYFIGQKFINDSEIIGFDFNAKKQQHQKLIKVRCVCLNTFTINRAQVSINLIKNLPCTCKECNNRLKSTNKSSSTEESIINNLYRDYSSSAKDRKLDFDLTLEKFTELIKGNCYYCGLNNDSYRRRYSKNIIIKRVGIDRVDNLKGYTIENSISCCKTCNRMKNIMNQEQFVNKAILIYKNLIEKGSTTIPSGSTL